MFSSVSCHRSTYHAVLTCEMKLFQDYFSLYRRPTEIVLFQRVENFREIILKIFQRIIAVHEYFSTCSMSLK